MAPRPDADRSFARYQSSGDPAELAAAFDATAPTLLQLARQLCRGDHATAEDLVQTTFLAAIEHRQRYRVDESVQAWLGGILTNKARDVARKQNRPLDIERLPERLAPRVADESMSPSTSAQQSELEGAIDRALDDLPNTYSEVLRPYLRRGLAAKSIAEQLGRPTGSVRTQIMRGIERLRGALPVGLAGAFAAYVTPGRGLAAVRTAVLEHSRQQVAIGTAATGTALTLGSFLLMKKTLFGIATAAAISAAAWFVSSPPEPTPTSSTIETSSAGTAAATPDASAPSAGSSASVRTGGGDRAEAAQPPKAATTGVELIGLVKTRDGQPVANARVLAWDRHDYPLRVDAGFDRPPIASTHSDQNGRFTMRAEGKTIELTADTEGLFAHTRSHVATLGRNRVEGIELSLAPTMTLEGTLLDADGQPIAGHRIGTHLGMSRSVNDETETAGVMRRRPDHVQTTTDGHGRFALRCLADFRYTFEVQHPTHPLWRKVHVPADGPLTIRLERGQSITGTVVRANGRPAHGARVRIADSLDRTTRCDTRGQFTLTGAEITDRTYLTVLDPESACHAVQPVDGEQPIEIRLEPALSIRGVVVDQNDRPIEGLRVAALGDRVVKPGYIGMAKPTFEWACGIDESTTDERGEFQFDNLYDGVFELRAYLGRGDERFIAQTVRSTTGRVRLRITPAASQKVALVGTVKSASTGQPVENFELTVHRHTDTTIGQRHPVTEPGEFSVSGLEPGRYSLAIQADGYALARTEVVSANLGTQRFEIVLHEATSAEFHIVDAHNRPVVANLALLDHNGKRLWIPTPYGSSSGLHTKDDGTVRAHGLPRTAFRVAVSRHPLPTERFPVDLTTPPTAPIRLVVASTPKDVPIRLNVLEVAPGVARDSLPTILRPSDRPRLRQLLQQGKIAFPTANIEVELVDAQGRQLCSATATYSAPEIEGGEPEYAIEESYRRARTGYGGSSKMPVPVLTLHGIPGTLTAKVKVAGRPPATVTLRVEAGNEQAIEAFVYVPRPAK